MTKNSQQLFKLAQKFIPGGVNSPVRAFKSVGGEPIFITRGEGAYVFDADNNRYIDYVGSWGPMILGHANPDVIEKVGQALKNGFSFGASTQVEILLAQKLCELMPAIEMIRFVNSGTEAAMSAIRLARGYTKRNKIIKFSGCYHGHVDSMLVSAGSGALTLGVPNSAGIPTEVAQNTLVAEFNRLDEVAALFARYGEDIAAVIVEPVAGNMNLILPKPGFLFGLRQLCDKYQSLLIFDEIITGFRVGLGGAQAHYNIQPDLTLLGKIIGGGFPAAAFGGRSEVMRFIAPLGPVYQAGTLSGNPIAMTAGLATLECITQPGFYTEIIQTTEDLVCGLNQAAREAGIAFHAKHLGAMFGLFFSENKDIYTEAEVKRCNMQAFTHFFHAMLNAGVYFAPSAFEIGFVSKAHNPGIIEATLIAAQDIFKNFLNYKKRIAS